MPNTIARENQHDVDAGPKITTGSNLPNLAFLPLLPLSCKRLDPQLCQHINAKEHQSQKSRSRSKKGPKPGVGTGKLNLRVVKSKQQRGGGYTGKSRRILPQGVPVGEALDTGACGSRQLHVPTTLSQDSQNMLNKYKEQDKPIVSFNPTLGKGKKKEWKTVERRGRGGGCGYSITHI